MRAWAKFHDSINGWHDTERGRVVLRDPILRVRPRLAEGFEKRQLVMISGSGGHENGIARSYAIGWIRHKFLRLPGGKRDFIRKESLRRSLRPIRNPRRRTGERTQVASRGVTLSGRETSSRGKNLEALAQRILEPSAREGASPRQDKGRCDKTISTSRG